jgi:hypothetical protein
LVPGKHEYNPDLAYSFNATGTDSAFSGLLHGLKPTISILKEMIRFPITRNSATILPLMTEHPKTDTGFTAEEQKMPGWHTGSGHINPIRSGQYRYISISH